MSPTPSASRSKLVRAHRRGFSLLELSLAAVVGALLVIVVLSLLSGLSRSEQALTARFNEAMELERVRLIMQRSFMSLVMSDQRPPPNSRSITGLSTSGRTSNATGNQTGGQTGGQTGSQTGSQTGGLAGVTVTDSRTATPPARLILSQVSGAPQRLEMVLQRNPVPRIIYSSAQATSAAIGGTAGRAVLPADITEDPMNYQLDPALVEQLQQEQLAEQIAGEDPNAAELSADQRREDRAADGAAAAASTTETTDDSALGRIVRGAFELRADAANPGAMELWWKPQELQPFPVNAASPPPTQPVPPAVRLAGNLVVCRWQVFDDRKMVSTYEGTYSVDLPAYVRMEIATGSGHYADWLFEIDYITSHEGPRSNAATSVGGVPIVGGAPLGAGGQGGPNAGGNGPRGSGGGPGGNGPRGGPGGGQGQGGNQGGNQGGGNFTPPPRTVTIPGGRGGPR